MKLSEYQECVLLAEYLDRLIQFHKLEKYTHVPNSTYTTSMTQKMKNKRMGVSAGFPDYIILSKKGLFTIEMKIVKGGVVSPEQKEWIATLNSCGVPSFVARGFDEAKTIIDSFVELH